MFTRKQLAKERDSIKKKKLDPSGDLLGRVRKEHEAFALKASQGVDRLLALDLRRDQREKVEEVGRGLESAFSTLEGNLNYLARQCERG